MPLLSLPFELRTRIYEALFHNCRLRWKDDGEIAGVTGHADCPAFLYVSKQFYAESHPIMLKTARINLTDFYPYEIEGYQFRVLELGSLRHVLYNCYRSCDDVSDVAFVLEKLPNLVSLTYNFGEWPCILYHKSGSDFPTADMTSEDFDDLHKSRFVILGGYRDASTESSMIGQFEMHSTVRELIRAWKQSSCAFKLQAEVKIHARNDSAWPVQPHVSYAVS